MTLRRLYEEYSISDQIVMHKRFVLVIPDKEYNYSHILHHLELSKIEVSVTYPKLSNRLKARELMIKEIKAVEPSCVIQDGIIISRIFDRFETTDELRRKVSDINEAFVNLHHHDEFSIRDGVGTVDGLIDLLQKRKQSFCCVTNHGSIGGWIKQHDRCKKANIQPIYAAEIYYNQCRSEDPEEKKLHRKNHHLITIAKNEEGFYNLIKIHNDAQLNGFYYAPRANMESLKKWGKGIIGLSACYSSKLSQLLLEDKWEEAREYYNQCNDAFDEFYIEMTMIEWDAQVEMNKKLIKFAKEVNGKLTVSLDSHYLYADHKRTHDILMLIKSNKTVLDAIENPEEVWQFEVGGLYYRNEKELRELWSDMYESDEFPVDILNEAIKNTRKIALSCEDINLDSDFKLPKLYDNSEEELQKRCENGMKKKGLNGIDKYEKRMEFELDIINELGFADYFLVVEKLCNKAREKFGEFALGLGRGCFDPNSKVLMSNGDLKEISSIKVGDLVFSHTGYSNIVDAVLSYDIDEEMIKIKTDNTTIKCTLDHEILTLIGDKERWVQAKDLIRGDKIVDVRAFKSSIVESKERYSYKGKVYDLNVQKDHSYNIEGLAVHNSAAGSLVSYCLGITDLDPVQHKLLFERFLDFGRGGYSLCDFEV